jgi:cytochrome c-type biogenesis protein CcmH
VALLVLCLTLTMPALAVRPDEMLADPALEARAREISRELRCVVCQNQSIDDSDADLARDLRLLVRERLQAGDSDRAVLAYVVSRYGDFVLLRPPLKPATYALWFGPPLVLLLGALALALFLRRRRHAVAAGHTEDVDADGRSLSSAEEERLARLTRDAMEAGQ